MGSAYKLLNRSMICHERKKGKNINLIGYLKQYLFYIQHRKKKKHLNIHNSPIPILSFKKRKRKTF